MGGYAEDLGVGLLGVFLGSRGEREGGAREGKGREVNELGS